ncbi:MAG: hypothetical protein K1X71_16750 [Pirellulales bacterium]|nr:hypothetical protein [Pirellulales bacterium]
MHRAFVFAVAIGIVAQLTAARAAPILDVFVTDLGDGYYGYDLWVDAADGEQRSLFAELSFNGEIQQQRALGRIDVDSDVQAAQFSELTEAAYAMEWDSYFSSPWTENSMSITSGPGNYAISAGTGDGSEFERLSLGHIVSRSPLAVSGSVARAGSNYLLAGNFDPMAGLRQSLESVLESAPFLTPNDPVPAITPPVDSVAPIDDSGPTVWVPPGPGPIVHPPTPGMTDIEVVLNPSLTANKSLGAPELLAAIPPGATIFNGVPEPSSLALAIAASAGLLLALRRSRRHVGAK